MMIRQCSRCDFAHAGSISLAMWGPRRSMRILGSRAFLLATLCLAITTVGFNASMPTSTTLFSPWILGQLAFGLFAGGIMRILVPTATSVSLTVFWMSLLLLVVILEGWTSLLISDDQSVYFMPPPPPSLPDIAHLFGYQILPAAGGFFVAALSVSTAREGIRIAINRRRGDDS